MAIDISIDTEQRIFSCKYTGSVNDDEIYAAWRDFYESGSWRKGWLEFSDFSELKTASISPTGIQRVAQFRYGRHQKANAKQEYLMYAPTALGFGLCRMYHTYSETSSDQITLVRTIREVEEYLERYSQNKCNCQNS